LKAVAISSPSPVSSSMLETIAPGLIRGSAQPV
jgi:hypothetical protein